LSTADGGVAECRPTTHAAAASQRSGANGVVRYCARNPSRTAAEIVDQKVAETLIYYAYPSTLAVAAQNNPLERISPEIRRRTPVVGAFPDGHSALILIAARLRHIASTKRGKRRYMLMEPLLNPAKQEAAA
jgi:putative transposase